jgi:hypothetical protein
MEHALRLRTHLVRRQCIGGSLSLVVCGQWLSGCGVSVVWLLSLPFQHPPPQPQAAFGLGGDELPNQMIYTLSGGAHKRDALVGK